MEKSLRKFTLSIVDENLREKYIELNSTVVLKTAIFFTIVRIINQIIIYIQEYS